MKYEADINIRLIDYAYLGCSITAMIAPVTIFDNDDKTSNIEWAAVTDEYCNFYSHKPFQTDVPEEDDAALLRTYELPMDCVYEVDETLHSVLVHDLHELYNAVMQCRLVKSGDML